MNGVISTQNVQVLLDYYTRSYGGAVRLRPQSTTLPRRAYDLALTRVQPRTVPRGRPLRGARRCTGVASATGWLGPTLESVHGSDTVTGSPPTRSSMRTVLMCRSAVRIDVRGAGPSWVSALSVRAAPVGLTSLVGSPPPRYVSLPKALHQRPGASRSGMGTPATLRRPNGGQTTPPTSTYGESLRASTRSLEARERVFSG